LQFPTNAFGGGLGACLAPLTGSHYGAWLYPEGSLGGSNVLKLIKFQNWSNFGYNGSSTLPMQQVSLPAVGTNWHTLKLAFRTNQLTVTLDGSQLIAFTDTESQVYPSGSVSADMWTDATNYTMSLEDVLVGKLGGDEVLIPAVSLVIQSITISNNVASVSWSTLAGHTYRLQYNNGLAST